MVLHCAYRQVLGGGTPLTRQSSQEERRAAAAAAAEARASGWRQGGSGNAEKNKQLALRRQKEDLCGKITELYAKRGSEPPFGLAASSIETLKRHLEMLTASDSKVSDEQRKMGLAAAAIKTG